MAEPRGIRNNNPGNLREFGIPWKGKTGSDGAFTKFATPELGIRAMTKDIYGDFARKGKRTVRAITSEYAPPTENNTNAYVNTVAQALGVGPDDEIDLTDEQQMLKLVRAKIGVENGKNPYTDEQILAGIRSGMTGAPLPTPTGAAEAGIPDVNTLPPRPFSEDDLSPNNPFSLYETQKMERAADEATPGFFEAVGLSMGQDWTTSWLLASKPEFKPDPDFVLDAGLYKELTANVPKEYWDYFEQAHSTEHAKWLKARMTADLESEARLASLGWSGVALRLGVSLLDPVNLLTAGATGGLSYLSTGSKGARVVKGAVSGAAINTALTVPAVLAKPVSSDTDLLYAAGLGLVFGGVGSGLTRGAMTPEEALLAKTGKDLMREAEGGAAAGKSSVGAAQNYAVVDPLNAQSAIDAANAKGEATAFGAVRWDAMATLKNSDNPLVSAFGGRLAEDAVGNLDKTKATAIGATEEAGLIHRRMEVEYQSAFEANFSAWSKRTGVKWGQRASARTRFGELTTAAVRTRNPTSTFDPEVMAQAGVYRDLMRKFNELSNNPGLLDGTTRRPVKGFGAIPNDDHYATRIWHGQKMALALERFGFKQVAGVIAGSIRAAQANIDPALAEKMAEAVIKRQREKSVGIMGYIDPFGNDDLNYVRVELRQMGIAENDIENLLGPLKPSGDAGAVSRGKRRIDLSEDFSTVLQDAKSGQAVRFRLDDLFENDATALFNSYSRTQSGWIALSRLRVKNEKFDPAIDPPEKEWIVDGITNPAEYEAFAKKVREASDELGITKDRTDTEVSTMDFLYKAIVGIPADGEQTTGGQVLRLLRDYNFLRLMGQVGFAQIAEVFTGVSQLGIKATLQGVPGFKALWRNAKTGKLNDDFAREVEWITTAGSDWLRGKNLLRTDEFNTPLANAFGTGKGAKLVGQIDHLQQVAKRGVSQISGMNAVNTFIQRWGASSIMYHFLNLSKNPTKANMQRMASLGLDDAMLQRVLGQIRTHAQTVPGGMGGRKLRTMGLQQWTDVEAAHAFELAVFRQARRIVQENDPGMMHRYMANPLMKQLLQFRTFVLGAWTKQFLHNVHMRDFAAFATFMSSTFAAGLSYIAQTHLQSVGRGDREEFLDQRLSVEKVGLAAFQRAGWASIFPMIGDSAMRLAGEEPVFDFRTTGQASDVFFGNPTFGLLNDTIAGSGAMFQTLTGDELSQADARSIARPLALQNALPFTMLLNTMTGDLPKRDPFKD